MCKHLVTPSKLDVLDSSLDLEDVAAFKKYLKKYQDETDEYWEFEIVPNMFKQSDPETESEQFDYLSEHFGSLHSWPDLFSKLDSLNESALPNEKFKVFFLARHGQGYHNLAHAKYGDKEWNEHYSKMYGDEDIVWGPDPDLTSLGKSQAVENNKQWQKEILNGCRIPSTWISSPLSRSIDTLILTWDKIVDLNKVKPMIKEQLRETIGVHTCDKRSTRSKICSKYYDRGFKIEPGFAEEDIYFKSDYRESVSEHAARIQNIFQYAFDLDDTTINMTSHSGSIRASLLVLNHRTFPVGTGGMIPVFVKGTRVLSQNAY